MRRLGKPIREVVTGDALDPRFEYPGLEVAFGEGSGVEHIRSADAKYCTSSGVCPGTSFANAASRLGQPMSSIDPSSHGGRFDYRTNQDTCWLEVRVASNEIESLEINCQP
ncbi:MAG TPA: hypothetical protein VFD69_13260 [Vicinamibacterales bacterium]|nr:hypothetical protein [Vicinamibacterales bacterium]